MNWLTEKYDDFCLGMEDNLNSWRLYRYQSKLNRKKHLEQRRRDKREEGILNGVRVYFDDKEEKIKEFTQEMGQPRPTSRETCYRSYEKFFQFQNEFWDDEYDMGWKNRFQKISLEKCSERFGE